VVDLKADTEKTHIHISLKECRTKSQYKVANKYTKNKVNYTNFDSPFAWLIDQEEDLIGLI
jgi:hypothetical protein